MRQMCICSKIENAKALFDIKNLKHIFFRFGRLKIRRKKIKSQNFTTFKKVSKIASHRTRPFQKQTSGTNLGPNRSRPYGFQDQTLGMTSASSRYSTPRSLLTDMTRPNIYFTATTCIHRRHPRSFPRDCCWSTGLAPKLFTRQRACRLIRDHKERIFEKGY